MRMMSVVPATFLLLTVLGCAQESQSPEKQSPETQVQESQSQEPQTQEPQSPATKLAESWLAREPADGLGEIDLATAKEAQKEFVEAIREAHGEVIGYKAALTSAPSQERFGVDHPLRGTLFSKMILPSGTEISLDVGTRLLFEGDLIVRVGDEALNEAKTREEALAALDAALPFLEVPDLPYAEGVPMNAASLTAVNAGARTGVVGSPISLAEGDDWVRRLADLEVVLFDAEGGEISRGLGAGLLGHPLEAVLWLRDSLAADGVRLSKGDLLSLGSITPLLPARPGRVTARYSGLGDEPIEIEVVFVAP